MSLFRLCIIALCCLLLACASQTGERTDNLPMYGQPNLERPAVLKAADQDFIAEAAAELGTREKASQVWHAQGDKLMSAQDLDLAMRRYNQSWLLNPKNYQAYWGFARVMVAKRRYEEAFQFFEQAIALNDDPYQKPALLGDYAIALHNKANVALKGDSPGSEQYFAKANELFESSTQSDPSYVTGWLKWAFSLYIQKEYTAAWEKVKRVRSLDSSIIPDEFLANLRAKMIEPADLAKP